MPKMFPLSTYITFLNVTLVIETFKWAKNISINYQKLKVLTRYILRGGTHLSEGLTGLAEKTKEQTIKQ